MALFRNMFSDLSQAQSRLYQTTLFPVVCWFGFRIPRSVHPNLITLFGIISYSASLIVDTKFWPLCWFLGFFFDCCDGFHARNTGQCSAFGHASDHSCDATSILIIVTRLSRLYRIDTQRELGLLFVFSYLGQLATSLERSTGHFLYGTRYFGTFEIILIACGLVPLYTIWDIYPDSFVQDMIIMGVLGVCSILSIPIGLRVTLVQTALSMTLVLFYAQDPSPIYFLVIAVNVFINAYGMSAFI